MNRRFLIVLAALGFAGWVAVMVVVRDDTRREGPVPRATTSTASTAAASSCVPPSPGEQTGTRVVLVFFTCTHDPDNEARVRTVAVPRRVPATPNVLELALSELLRGPTRAEREAGLGSPFGPDTAGMLKGVSVRDGLALFALDESFASIPEIGIHGTAQTAYGQLVDTVFQFPTVERVVFSVGGSERRWCELWEVVCEPIARRSDKT